MFLISEFGLEHMDTFLYGRAYARIVEYNLLSFRENRLDESIKTDCKLVRFYKSTEKVLEVIWVLRNALQNKALTNYAWTCSLVHFIHSFIRPFTHSLIQSLK